MMKRVCLYEYADLSKESRVCTRKRTFQVTYGQKRSKSEKQGPVVLKTHGIDLARGIEGSWYCFGPWY